MYKMTLIQNYLQGHTNNQYTNNQYTSTPITTEEINNVR